jgi:Co/Zn/Cd efflux system component
MEQEQDTTIPSNEKLLGTEFVTFMSFSLTQLLFAVIAGSKTMMGDSAAMIVDAISYLFNYIAEREQKKFDAVRETKQKMLLIRIISSKVRQRQKMSV